MILSKLLPHIDKLAFLHIQNRRLLLAKSYGKDAYYIPGGKREANETDEEALTREVKEELSIDMIPSTLKFIQTFTAQAHGKPEGTMVNMRCYTGDFTGKIQAAAEIETLDWYQEDMNCSIATHLIANWLKENHFIDTSAATTKLNETESPLDSTFDHYEWILFDADETLFRFDDFTGLKNMFLAYNVTFTEQDYQDYKKINETLWKSYQNAEITAEEIRQQRFSKWGEKLNKESKELNSAFLTAMSNICEPLEGAISLLNTLKRQGKKLGIITNGFTEWQELRLARLNLTGHINVLVTSEQAGVAKPDRTIFNYALSRMRDMNGSFPCSDQVLMVGDNPYSDILGGMNAGLHTCWFNAHTKPTPSDITPTYQVSSLQELEALFQPIKKSSCTNNFPFWSVDSNALVSKQPIQSSQLTTGVLEKTNDATCQY